MAAVASVFLITGRRVAYRARRRMIFIKHEELIVVEGRRLPCIGAVALAAGVGNLLVESISRFLMAGCALFVCRRVEQIVREPLTGPELHHTSMVAMAGNAVLFLQFLMKGYLGLIRGHRYSFGGSNADIGHLMTGDAFLR